MTDAASVDAPRTRRPSRWRTWRRLSWSERLMFAETALLIPAMALSLRLFDVGPSLAWVDGAFRARTLAPDAEALMLRRTVDALRRTRRYAPYAGSCLPRALALKFMLARRGLRAELRFGAKLEAQRLEAHAWVERNGVVLDDKPELVTQFVPLPSAASAPPSRASFASRSR